MLGDGFFVSVMIGLGETYVPAFALAMGLGEVVAGLVMSVPLLAGAVLQLLSPRAVQRLGTPRKWVVPCAYGQAACFLPLAFAAWYGQITAPILFVIAAGYWGCGMASGAAWNIWAEALVPRIVRANYFAGRTRYCQGGVFIGFVLGGLLLQTARTGGWLLPAFAMLFLIAAVCRFGSAYFLSLQTETRLDQAGQRHVTIMELVRRLRSGGPERLLAYLITVQFAVYISGPYFNPFMLKQLGFSYQTYMGVVASAYLAKALSMPLLGILVRRFGTHRLLWFGAAGIVPLSSLWLFSQSFEYLLVVQLVGGIFWAAYELAMLLLFFETISKEERTSLLTLYNLGNSLAIVLGASLGGAILKIMGERVESYLFVFVTSSVVRVITLGYLTWLLVQMARKVTTVSSVVENPASATATLALAVTDSSPAETMTVETPERVGEPTAVVPPAVHIRFPEKSRPRETASVKAG